MEHKRGKWLIIWLIIYTITSWKIQRIKCVTATEEVQLVKDMSMVHEAYLVDHYDCRNPQQMTMYETVNMARCALESDTIERQTIDFDMYIKLYARYVDGYMCKVSYVHERWFCGQYSHSSLDAHHASITMPLLITGDQCKKLAESSPETSGNLVMMYDGLWKTTFQINFHFDKAITTVRVTGKDTSQGKSWDCKGKGLVNRFTFMSIIKKVTLTHSLGTGRILDTGNIPLPCDHWYGKCDSSYLTGEAYTWDTNEGCVLQKKSRHTSTMVKWENRYFIISNQSEIEELGYKFEVMPGRMSMCFGIGDMVYATNHDTLFISIKAGGFNLHTGKQEDYNGSPADRKNFRRSRSFDNKRC